MSLIFLLPLYIATFAILPLVAAFFIHEIVSLLGDIKRSKKEKALFN